MSFILISMEGTVFLELSQFILVGSYVIVQECRVDKSLIDFSIDCYVCIKLCAYIKGFFEDKKTGILYTSLNINSILQSKSSLIRLTRYQRQIIVSICYPI